MLSNDELPRVLESDIHRLPWILPVDRLEELLRKLGNTGTLLSELPPLGAALRFREAVQERLRSGSVTAASFRRAVLQVEEALRGGTPHLAVAPPLDRHFDRALFVFGLRRGGNHALAEWLKGHFPEGSVLHLNNAEIGFFKARGETLRIDHAHHANVAVSAEHKALLVGYENLEFVDFPMEQNRRIAARCDLVVVLRDYLNMAASIARNAKDRPALVYTDRLRDFPIKWNRYARHFREGTAGVIFVKFNRWFSDPAYRQELSREIGLEFSDQGLNIVSAHGRGSSFEGAERDGDAQSMDVMTRWQEMLGNELFRFLVLADEENLALNQELFGNFPAQLLELLDK